jgi:hypothetical protein
LFSIKKTINDGLRLPHAAGQFVTQAIMICGTKIALKVKESKAGFIILKFIIYATG